MAKVLVIAEIKQGVLKGSTAELLSKAKAIGAETAVVAVPSGAALDVEGALPVLGHGFQASSARPAEVSRGACRPAKQDH